MFNEIVIAVIAFCAGLYFYRVFMVKKIKTNLPELLKSGAVVLDVRNPSEFVNGQVDGCVNIPMGQLTERLSELDKNKTYLVVCAAGGRSAVAAALLKNNGFDNAINAGGFKNLLPDQSKS